MSGSAGLYEVIVVILSALTAYPIVIVAQNRNGQLNVQYRELETLRENKATEMMKYMNDSVDPCTDFYEFACGNWPEFNKPSQEGEITTPIQIIDNNINILLQKAMEKTTPHDAPDIQKLKRFYNFCATADNKSKQKHEFLIDFLREYGGLPSLPTTNYEYEKDYNWVKIIAELRLKYGLDILIGLENDFDTHHKKSLFLSEPSETVIPIELCSEIATNSMDIQDEAYESLQTAISQNWQSWLSMRESEANRIAGDIVNFEFQLCKQMRKHQTLQLPDEESSEENKINVGPRRGQSRLHNNNRQRSTNAQNPQYFTRIFKNEINFSRFVDISLNMTITEVYMKSEAYFTHLVKTVKASSKPTLANYIMYRALSIFNLPSDDRAHIRPQHCINILLKYLPEPMNLLYQSLLRVDKRQEVKKLFPAVQNALKDNIRAGWMDAKEAIRDKIAQFSVQMPEYGIDNIDGLTIDSQDHYWNQLNTLLQYVQEKRLDSIHKGDYSSSNQRVDLTDTRFRYSDNYPDHEVRIGMALLQSPIFEQYYSNALKFAGIGQLMSRELVSAVLSDQSLLNEEDKNELQKHSECLRKQYSNYLYNNPTTFRNATKLNELMADMSAFNAAFRAYLAWLEIMDPTNKLTMRKETLPTMDFTNTQLFFIAFAQTRCVAKFDNEPPPEFLPLDRHTPERYNVIGSLANSVEFAREFGCSTGTEMSPDDKCVIF